MKVNHAIDLAGLCGLGAVSVGAYLTWGLGVALMVGGGLTMAYSIAAAVLYASNASEGQQSAP